MAQENDIVIVHIDDAPPFFARIETIFTDVKKDWFQVKLLILQVPMNSVTWILRDVYINGQTFQMNGKNVTLEHVPFPFDQSDNEEDIIEEEKKIAPQKEGKVISFSSAKKKKE